MHPRPVTWIASIFVCRWSSYLTGNPHGPPRPVTGINLLLLAKFPGTKFSLHYGDSTSNGCTRGSSQLKRDHVLTRNQV
jgi:hypothetical protein